MLIKNNLSKTILSASIVFFSFFLTACHDDKDVIKVGTIAGPETELAEVAATVAEKKYGLHIKLVTFSDYLQPNAALEEGSLQANVFQHHPYLDQQVNTYGYKLAAVGKTFVYPMGIYSATYHDLQSIPDALKVAIPNDPSNEARALLLLQSAGLIELNHDHNLNSTPQDIVDNPKKLNFVELDAAQLTRAYHDVDLAVINTNYAIPAGLYPSRDALYLESKDSPYANLIVVRQTDVDQPWVQNWVDALHSQAVVDKANDLFQGQALASFTVISDSDPSPSPAIS